MYFLDLTAMKADYFGALFTGFSVSKISSNQKQNGLALKNSSTYTSLIYIKH